MSELGQQPPRRGQIGMSALSPKAAAAVADRSVGFGPFSDEVRWQPLCPYSITSSAVARSDGGNDIPITLAAFSFSVSANFVGN
jgi:hypothetical protein